MNTRPPNGPHLRRNVAGRLLLPYPITTAVFFTVVGVSPLFLAGAYTVRLQEELGFGTSEFGYSVSAYFLVAAITSARFGPVVDRLGSFIGFRLATAGTTLAALVLALFASNWVWVAVGLGISGMSNTFAQLGANRVIAANAGGRRQGIGFGAKQAAIPLGSLLAGGAVSILGVDVAWERSFFVLALLAIIAGIIAPRFGAAPSSSGEHVRGGVGDAWPHLALLAAAGGAGGATGNSLAVLVVDAFETEGFTESAAAGVLAFGSAASITVRLLVGWFIDRNQRQGAIELGTLMVVGSVGFLLLAIAGSSRPLLFLGVFLGFAAGWGWPAIIYLVTTRTTEIPPATATGFVLTGVYTGTIIGPLTLGTIAEDVSFQAAWGVASATILLGAVLVALSHRMLLRREAGTT